MQKGYWSDEIPNESLQFKSVDFFIFEENNSVEKYQCPTQLEGLVPNECKQVLNAAK